MKEVASYRYRLRGELEQVVHGMTDEWAKNMRGQIEDLELFEELPGTREEAPLDEPT